MNQTKVLQVMLKYKKSADILTDCKSHFPISYPIIDFLNLFSLLDSNLKDCITIILSHASAGGQWMD